MNRWPDGSVQHVMLSFWLSAPAKVEVTFRNQARPDAGGQLTASEMLSEEYEFSGVMELDGGGHLLRADARDILSAGDFRYWLAGPICTQVIIEDRRADTKHDLGWDAHRSFHPIFVATFYPGWSGVKVEMIGESTWTTRLQDLKYALKLRTGTRSASKVVYQKPEFTHFALTRWRKVFWSGEAPPPANLDLNFAYMIYSKVLPSYDLTKKVSAERIREDHDSFRDSDQGDIGGSARWVKYFPTSGGRQEIGLFPSFYVDYLYTFDKRLHEVMLGYAAASGHVPIHFRESDPGRVFLKGSRGGDAMGRPISVDSRPTLWAGDGRGYTAPEDRITPVAKLGDSGWSVDKAHQGSFAYIPYLVTGDWYFLEELYFWASYNIASSEGCSAVWGTCRVGALGFIPPANQHRGVAWALRTVGHAAFIAPDDTPEKFYFRNKLYNNIAVYEGFFDIKDGSFHRSPYTDDNLSAWNFGRALSLLTGENPLYYPPVSGYTPLAEVDGSVVLEVESPWAMNFMYVVLGHLEELGAPVTAWKEKAYISLLDRLTHPDFNPYLVAAYRIPQLTKDSRYFTTWRSVMAAYLPAVRNTTEMGGGVTDVSNGYPFIALAAASFLPGMSHEGRTGDDAWAWLQAHVKTELFNRDPKWALVPRPASEPAPAKWPIPNASESTGRRGSPSGR